MGAGGNKATRDSLARNVVHAPLDEAIGTIRGIGPKRAVLLGNLGIRTVRDLLFHFPRDYQDRRTLTPIDQAVDGATLTVCGTVTASRLIRMRGRTTMAVVTLRDETGEINATWFGRGFLAKSLTEDTRLLLTGTVGKYKGLALKNPDYEVLVDEEEDRLHSGRIVPLYGLTEKITHRMLRVWIRTALDDFADTLEETLSESVLSTRNYPPLREALETIHFPDDLAPVPSARERFAYEELLNMQLGVLRVRAARQRLTTGCQHRVDGPTLHAFERSLSFTLTAGQQEAVRDVLRDMASPQPMGRLLQGDVGSGKTVVALHAIAAACDGGFQSALMAPTEILAEQHYRSIRNALTPLGIRVILLTGSTRDIKQTHRDIAGGDARVIIGTHALIQDKIGFHRLGLVIVDEQHRFGVGQRARLAKKGRTPDILHMTATPIPRTLALTVYGAMDQTVIEELPPGRLPIRTHWLDTDDQHEAYDHVRNQAEQGFQSYIICPLVEESDSRQSRAVLDHMEELSGGVLSSLKLGIVHGRLDADARDAVMNDFAQGTIDVLLSTTVVEVGVDIPNATTIVIEDAGDFGLTQLHQLRGRVGRGSQASTCFLLGDAKTDEGKRRLEIMCETNDGFAIAEEDLRQRGPGEVYGFRQSGLGELKIADLTRDGALLRQARRDAEAQLRDG